MQSKTENRGASEPSAKKVSSAPTSIVSSEDKYISVETNFIVEDFIFERCQTTEKHFNEIYSEALKYLTDAVS